MLELTGDAAWPERLVRSMRSVLRVVRLSAVRVRQCAPASCRPASAASATQKGVLQVSSASSSAWIALPLLLSPQPPSAVAVPLKSGELAACFLDDHFERREVPDRTGWLDCRLRRAFCNQEMAPEVPITG